MKQAANRPRATIAERGIRLGLVQLVEIDVELL